MLCRPHCSKLSTTLKNIVEAKLGVPPMLFNIIDKNLQCGSILFSTTLQQVHDFLSCISGDLKTRKSTGASCQMEIHYSNKLLNFVMK